MKQYPWRRFAQFREAMAAPVGLAVLLLATEAEARAYTDPGTGALIWQMLEALETCDESDGYTGLRQFFDDKAVEAAITARRAGGACPQSRGSD